MKGMLIFDINNVLLNDKLSIQDIKTVLESLKRDFYLVIVSNASKEIVDKELSFLGIRHLFDSIGYFSSLRSLKPLRSAYKHLEKYNYNHNMVYVVGSSVVDIIAAKLNGFKSICVGKCILKADYHIEHIKDLFKIFYD